VLFRSNTTSTCGAVAREVCQYVDHLILIDDGSTDGTNAVLREVAEEQGKRISLLTLTANQGKGHALIAGFRHALAHQPFDVLVTLDSDGQHRPANISTLLDAWRGGGDFVMGERRIYSRMPWRSRFGNQWIARLLRCIYPTCPNDTQSGFRILSRNFVQRVINRIEGRRYETEFQILLLALKNHIKIRTVDIPTIDLENNQASHFRPIFDSMCIITAFIRWLLSSKG
jgi:glycosyltransferase involved in cell wall biosynthesis